jgi:hypothetical protein
LSRKNPQVGAQGLRPWGKAKILDIFVAQIALSPSQGKNFCFMAVPN